MKIVNCPYCNFPSHAVCLIERSLWRYCCDRCKQFFVFDIENERVV